MTATLPHRPPKEQIHVAVVFGVAKGTTLSAVLAAIDVGFIKALIIAVVSGLIGSAGAIAASIIATRAQHETKKEITDVKRGLGLDKRQEDQPPHE